MSIRRLLMATVLLVSLSLALGCGSSPTGPAQHSAPKTEEIKKPDGTTETRIVD